MRIVFMGSPDFSVPALACLLEAGHEVVCVYSQPPRPAGRGKSVRPTPVHAFAEAKGLSVRTPKSLKRDAEQEALAALEADIAVVVAYGLILPQAVLDAPRLGCINLHASLLPRWRGAAPIQRAIMAGDAETGVQAMVMEAGLDTGPVLATAKTPIAADDTASRLHDRLAGLGAGLLPEVLVGLDAGTLEATPQVEAGATYASKLTAADQVIDWTQPARMVDCQIRGLADTPGARFTWQPDPNAPPLVMKALLSSCGPGGGAPGTVLDDNLLVACGEGAVRLMRVQRPGKGPMAAEIFLRGSPIAPGTVFS
ncbi:MAG: methionyl-tRNA formyltransferase [Pseudomonadota bacterium]